MHRALAHVLGIASAIALLTGCGNSRTRPPSLAYPAAPTGFRTLTFPAAGVRLSAPVNWTVTSGRGHLLTVLSSGAAVAALWRYPRARSARSSTAALQQAERRLVAGVRARDPRFELIGSSGLRIDGYPAVQLNGLEQLNGVTRRVRSTHVFRPGAEIVLDEYAPPGVFDRVAREVFVPVKRSLSVSPTSA